MSWRAARSPVSTPTAVEPVSEILLTSGWSTSARPSSEPRPTTTPSRPAGRPAAFRDPLQLQRGQRGQLGRLVHDRVAGGQRRRDLPARDRQRKVPRRDHADDPERLAEGHVDPAGDRDRAAAEALRRRRVEAEGRRRARDRAARVGDRHPDVAGLQARQRLGLGLDPSRDGSQRRAALARRPRPPLALRAPRLRDDLVQLGEARPRERGEHRLRRRLDDLDGHRATSIRLAARSAAAATRSAIVVSSSSSSGCHWTPSA